MNQMTGEEFVKKIEKNLSWCLDVTAPLEITSFVDLTATEITHLSPLLHFTGIDSKGWSGAFAQCENLKEACGTFHGFVNFYRSGIKTVKDLKVLSAVESTRWSANFGNCHSLTILEGEFEGAVFLESSGIKLIKATVKHPSIAKYKEGIKFFLSGCENLVPHEKYLYDEFQIDETIRKKCLKIKEKRKAITRFDKTK